jgi:hypothetical protein
MKNIFTSEQSDPVLEHKLDLEGLHRRFTEGKRRLKFNHITWEQGG